MIKDKINAGVFFTVVQARAYRITGHYFRLGSAARGPGYTASPPRLIGMKLTG